MCLLAICMSSSEKCLFSLWPIFWLGHLFFWNWASGVACIFLRLILCCFICYYFLPIWGLSFHLIVSFVVQKLLSFIRSHLFIFAFISNILGGERILLWFMSESVPLSFLIVQLSHPYMTTGKTVAFTRHTFAGKVMSLLCNMLSRLVITFLPRSKCLFMAAVTICSDFGAP